MCRSLFQDQEPRTDTYFDFTDQDTRKIEGFLNVLGNFATEELPIPRFIQGREEDDLADLWSFSYGVMLTKLIAYKEKVKGIAHTCGTWLGNWESLTGKTTPTGPWSTVQRTTL